MPHPAGLSLGRGARHRTGYACAPLVRERPAGYDLSAPRNLLLIATYTFDEYILKADAGNQFLRGREVPLGVIQEKGETASSIPV